MEKTVWRIHIDSNGDRWINESDFVEDYFALEREIAGVRALCTAHYKAKEAAERERDEIKELHRKSCDLVIPGHTDSSDAYRIMMADLKHDRDTLKEKLAQVERERDEFKRIVEQYREAYETRVK